MRYMILAIAFLLTVFGYSTVDAVPAQWQAAASCYTQNDVYCTAISIDDSAVICNPGCQSIYMIQFDPSRSCRWRVYYRIPGSGNDWHTDGVLMNPYGWYDQGGQLHSGWGLIGTHISNASSYDVQVRCGPSYAGSPYGQVGVF